MKVKITKIARKRYTDYQADIAGLPNAPIGRGKTPQEAVIFLLYRILHDPTVDWRKHIDFSKVEIEEAEDLPGQASDETLGV